ncbi:MAG: carbohydrate binding family 9 domain-containing protein [Acidimicrobiia bacterium]|nr:carbohydrate binding family 9 domain-containing protein [Acidimicrobiia bacterium]
MRARVAVVLAAISWLSPPPSFSQAATQGVVTLQDNGAGAATGPVVPAVLSGRPVLAAVRAGEPPRIDGRLDDALWRTAARVTEFFQQRPLEGAPASERTVIHVAYDSDALYFGIHARYSDLRLIRANRVDRDQTGRDDTVRVYIDPFLDQQRAYVFSVNAYGIQSDAVLRGTDNTGGALGAVTAARRPAGGMPTLLDRLKPPAAPETHTSGAVNRSGAPGDASWDALFDSAGRLVEDGWIAEMAIPFKSLRYPSRGADGAHRWGLQIERTIDSKDESVVWAPISRNVMGLLRQMGVLEGMTGLSTSRNIELLPTFTAISARTFDPMTSGYVAAGQPEAAINAKYGITPNLTLDVTYNPDFSQIESDRPQIEVNERFPVFYPELRPFFLEGQEIYQIAAPSPLAVVHTRTLVDLRYGAKLTGKVGKTSVGFLVANDQAPGRVDDRRDPAFDRTAKTVLGRVRYDLYSESHVGVIVTDREFLDGHSRLSGLDTVLRIGANHRFRATALAADRLATTGARRTGALLDVNLRKEGRHLAYDVGHNRIDPGFGTDLGFVQRTDQQQTTATVSYRWWPEHWIINWDPRVSYLRNYDYQGVLQDESVAGRVSVQFARSISAYGQITRDMERFRDIPFRKARWNAGGSVNTSRRVSFYLSYQQGDQVRFIDNPFLGSDRQLNLLVNVRPLSRLQSEIGMSTRQFVDVRSDRELFDVRLYRARTTYQFTDRLLLRNIVEIDTFERAKGGNLVATYRVNAGTVFFAGYDDHYGPERESHLHDHSGVAHYHLDPTGRTIRTNRAVFVKLQYLFRL